MTVINSLEAWWTMSNETPSPGTEPEAVQRISPERLAEVRQWYAWYLDRFRVENSSGAWARDIASIVVELEERREANAAAGPDMDTLVDDTLYVPARVSVFDKPQDVQRWMKYATARLEAMGFVTVRRDEWGRFVRVLDIELRDPDIAAPAVRGLTEEERLSVAVRVVRADHRRNEIVYYVAWKVNVGMLLRRLDAIGGIGGRSNYVMDLLDADGTIVDDRSLAPVGVRYLRTKKFLRRERDDA